MTRLDFFFDPICPWCWITSRWLTEVAPHRDVDVRWRSFSLYEKNYQRNEAAPESYDRISEQVSASHRALRISEAVRAVDGEAAVGDLYLELGRRIHHDGDKIPDLAEVVAAAGLDAARADAADDAAWDAVLSASMDEAIAVAGFDVGVPLLVFDGERGFFGPVISPRPTGDAALELFDAVHTLAAQPGFWELKRDRTSGPDVGARP